MKDYFVSLGAAVVIVLGTTNAARADLVHWSYQWSRSPDVILADAPGTGMILLSAQGLQDVVGDSDVVAANLRVYSTAPDANPDTFTNKAYALSLFLLDAASGQSGTVTYTGVFNGTASAHSSNLATTVTSPSVQSMTLGDNRYTAILNFFTPPGPPGAYNYGSIGAHVSISVDLIQSLPEPSALVLAGFGVLLVGMTRIQRWRRPPLRF